MKKFTSLFLLFLSFLLIINSVSADVFINEFLADAPAPEQPNEWIELYYDGTGTVDLTGWYINDSDEQGDTLTGILSSSNRFILFSGTQTNITLFNGFNRIYLYNSSGDLIDSITYPTAAENESEGREVDGSPTIVKFSTPTPNNKNDNKPPSLNNWLYPFKVTPTYIMGMQTVRANITDAVYYVNTVLLDFNGTNHSMTQNGDIWSYVWNTYSNPEGAYTFNIHFNDAVGNANASVLTGIYIDRTAPAIFDAQVNTNPRGYIAAGSTVYTQVRTTDSNPINNVTCTLDGIIEEAIFLGGNQYECSLNASQSQKDYTVIYNSEDAAGNINTTTAAFTTKNITIADINANDVTIPDLNQTDRDNILVNAVLTNNGNSPMYDAAIRIESIEGTVAVPDAYVKTCNETQLNASQSCSLVFNLTVAGGTPSKDYVIFWSANWTDNNFNMHDLTPFTRSYININPNPIIGVPANWTFSLNHGTNQTKQLQIDSIGNDNLTNIGIFYTAGSLPSGWVTIDSNLTVIPAGSNGLFDLTVTVPEFTYPGIYTGSFTITANGAVFKYVDLFVEVLLDNSWTIIPQNMNVYVAKSATGLVGTYYINNTGNIDQLYNITYWGDFYNKILDLGPTPSTLYVPKDNVGSLPIYIIDTRDQTNYTLNIDIEGNNSVYIYATMNLYVGDNAPLVSSWYWETAAANSTAITTITVQENSWVYFEANITDPDGEAVDATWILDTNNVANDSVVSSGIVNWTYYPDLLSAGMHTVTLGVISANGNSGSINWTVNVTDNNQQPQIALQIPEQQLAEDSISTITNLTPYFIDPDPDNNLSYIVTQQNQSEVACIIDGDNLTMVPAFNWFGVGANAASCSVAANDGAANSTGNTFNINVTPVNDAPILIIDDVIEAYETLGFVYDVNATDPEGDSISEFSSDSTIFTIDPVTGIFNFIPALEDVGTHYIMFSVNDTFGATASKVVNFTVHFQNHAPILNPIGGKTVDEGSALQFTISAQDLDTAYGDNLTFSCNLGDITINKIGPITAEVSWIPSNNYIGDNYVEFNVSDIDGASDSEIINIEVIDVNNAPVIGSYHPTFDPKIPEDSSQSFAITKSDRDGDPLTAEWYVDGSLQGNGDSFTFNGDGSAGIHNYNVTVVVSDSIAHVSRSWLLTTSDVPVTSRYTGTIIQFSPGELESAANVVIENQYGRIDFGSALVDLSDVVDLDRYVNIDYGIIGVDRNKFPSLMKPAMLKMYGLTQSETPIIYYSSGFELSGSEVCPAAKCSNINYDGSTLEFDIDHFTIFWVTSATTNYPPVIVSEPVIGAKVNSAYSYDVDAYDQDNNVLSYSLTTSQGGMAINPTTGFIDWLPTVIGNYNVVVSVSDSIADTTQNFTIYVTETGIAPGQSMLAITDLDVKVDGDSDKNLNDGDRISEDAKPLSEIEFSIKVENMFTENIEIEDVSVTVEILDIDDGDDLDEESKDFDLDDGEDERVSLSFELPMLIEENVYEVVITVEGEDDNGNDHETEWTLLLDIDKESHDLIIYDVDIIPSVIRCNRYATLDLEVVNIGGRDEEDVILEIENDELGIDIKETGIELEHGTDEDDSVYERSMQLSIGDYVLSGTYPVDIKVYRDNKLMDSERVNMVVEECAYVEKKTEPIDMQLNIPTDLTQYVPIGVETEHAKISFKETDEYFMLLAMGFTVMLGLVVYLTGAVIILSKKK